MYTAPITYSIDVTRRVVYFRLHGDITYAGLREAHDAVLADAAYAPEMALYFDCRVLTSIPKREEIERIANDRLMRPAGVARGRAAMVVMTRLGMDFGAAWEVAVGPNQEPFAVFTAHSDAHRWLGVTVPETLD